MVLGRYLRFLPYKIIEPFIFLRAVQELKVYNRQWDACLMGCGDGHS